MEKKKTKNPSWQFYSFVKTMFWVGGGAVVQRNGRSLYGRLKIALQCVKMSGSLFNRTPWNSIFAARQKRQNKNSTLGICCTFKNMFLETTDLFSCTLGFCLLDLFIYFFSFCGPRWITVCSKGWWWK